MKSDLDLIDTNGSEIKDKLKEIISNLSVPKLSIKISKLTE